jgi:hypothetical protein
MDPDVARDDRAQAEQRRQVEDVRADHDADAELPVTGSQSGDRSRDLRRICTECGEDAVEPLGRAEPLADLVERAGEDEARNQARRDTGAEDRDCGRDGHRPDSIRGELPG